MALQLPLDLVSNTTCHGAYAAFRVSSSYTGPTINVRRSSDNATSDFYADPYGQFGTAVNGTGTTIESWLGTSIGYVATWYDQSGKGNHATQSTTSQQPIIDIIHNRIDFTANSGTSFLNLPNNTVPNNVPYTVTTRHHTVSTYGTYVGSGASTSSAGLQNNFRRQSTRYLNYWFSNDFLANDNVYSDGNIVTFAYDGSYSYLYINGTSQGVSPIRSGWNGQAGNEYIGRNSSGVNGSEYLNGQLYFLYLFKSYLAINERIHIERPMPVPPSTGPIKFSQLKTAFGITSSTFSIDQGKTLSGVSTTAVDLTSYTGFLLRNGLFMRIYWNRYHNNDPTWFNSNTPNIMGVTTNLRNTYCATAGFNNPNTIDTAIGGVGASTTYSVEWTGLFFAPVTGTYTFYLASDDSSYLWIGSNATSGYTTANCLINNLYTGPQERSATISLTGGQYYPFRLQFGDGGGGEFIIFSFAPPSGVRVYEGTGYFFCQTRNISGSNQYEYVIRNGSTEITTQIQGLTSSNPATSGYALFSANPWLPNGVYWIKSASMPNAMQLYVDIKNGGYDFYALVNSTSINLYTQTHSGTALGLDLVIPRSQNHWRAIYNYVYNVLGSDYPTYMKALPIYRTTTSVTDTGFGTGTYAAYAMFDPRLGNSGSTAGSYNGAPDWRCKDGGLWYLRHEPFGEPNGNYTLGEFLYTYSIASYPQWRTSYDAPGFDDAIGYGYTGTSYLVSTNYAGSTLNTLTHYFDGSTSERAAPSALYIKNLTGTNTNGVYWINLPTVGATQVYCIMDTAIDGGGWMMAMKATRGSTFQWSSSHWTTVTTLNPAEYNRNDGDAKFHSMNYFPSKDLLALWPDIPYNYNSGTGGSLSLSTYNNWCWMKNNYNSGTRQTLINYFSTANNVSFGTPKGVEKGTAFSSQAGNSFYGVNVTVDIGGNATRARWGFAWNNELDWGSGDVSGGIGMNNAAYSAGDWIGCCADTTGINRSARVEMYIR